METSHVKIKQSCNPSYTSIQTQPIAKDNINGPNKFAKNSILVVQRTRSFRRRAAHVNNSLYKFPKTVEKRNARERTRVHTVNQAFLMLKYRIPSIKSNAKRVSKLKILRAAINHIYSLSDLLEKAPQVSRPEPAPNQPSNSSEFLPCPQPTIMPKPIVDLASNNSAFVALPYMGYENLALSTHFNYPSALSQAALDQLCYPNFPMMNNFVNTNFI
uniref:BHLH domain-containing protein n=1 Tax=Acrobeloides nanus TaxID=290746 RepID=A0A914C3N5_9BILA